MANDKVTEILVQRILRGIEENNTLPWLTPWLYRYSFNWYTEHVYTGINRWLLPEGEYMTANQLNRYNKEKGTNYKFTKGIEWYPALFMKRVELTVKEGEISKELIIKIREADGKIVREMGYPYINNYYFDKKKNKIMRTYLCRRYYMVADIKWFKDENGKSPQSKVQSGEIVLMYEKPEKVVREYTEREGIAISHSVSNRAFFRYSDDTVYLPSLNDFRSEEAYYSVVYHELAHSTGTEKRLNRQTIALNRKTDTETRERSKEELIAEMCACLLCVETGVYNIHSNEELELVAYKNSQAYINNWYKYLKEDKDDLVYIASDAEKAFKFILGESISNQEESQDKIK